MTHFLLQTDENGTEEVLQYSDSEMTEIFTLSQLKDLDKMGFTTHNWTGFTTHNWKSHSQVRIVDMLAAARTVR